MKRYLVIPGYVVSKYDRDFHYVGASELMRLYGVSEHECVVAKYSFPPEYYDRLYPLLIHLVPLASGNYKIPSRENF